MGGVGWGEFGGVSWVGGVGWGEFGGVSWVGELGEVSWMGGVVWGELGGASADRKGHSGAEEVKLFIRDKFCCRQLNL